jgi:hypothetical protein
MGEGRLWLVLSLVTLAGCILFVSPADYGAHCEFQGMTTDCGACLAERCQTTIDACCGDSTCASILSSVDTCASELGDACTTLKDAAKSGTDPTQQALGSCVATLCAGECAASQGESVTKCSEPEFAEGTACTCSSASDGGANDFVCSSAVYPEALCCAPSGWPGPGLTCNCEPLECSSMPSGCSCSLSCSPFGSSSTTCSGPPHCCALSGSCSCSDSPCTSGETKVSSCSAKTAGCPSGAHVVESCSIRH